MTTNNEQYRAGFEAWARKEAPGHSLMMGRNEYEDYATQCAWRGWLAAKREASTDPVGIIVAGDTVHGWHMEALKPWNEIGAGAMLYLAGALPDEATDAALVEAKREGWADGMREAQELLGEEIVKAARYDYLVAQYPCNIADALDCGISEIGEEVDRCIEHDAAIEAHIKAGSTR